MIRFFLHGGEFEDGGGLDSDYFSQLLHFDDKRTVHLLLVYFARPIAKWPYLFEEDKRTIDQCAIDSVVMREATFDDFPNELVWADVVFFKGGDGPILTDHLSHYHDLRETFMGKNIGGISAGVNALSKYYYSRRGHRVIEGLGILNIKAFTHYEDRLQDEYDDLDQTGEKLEIVTIPEGKFVLIEDQISSSL